MTPAGAWCRQPGDTRRHFYPVRRSGTPHALVLTAVCGSIRPLRQRLQPGESWPPCQACAAWVYARETGSG